MKEVEQLQLQEKSKTKKLQECRPKPSDNKPQVEKSQLDQIILKRISD